MEDDRLVVECGADLLPDIKPIFVSIVKRLREHLRTYGMSFSDPVYRIGDEGRYIASRGFYVDFDGDVQVAE